MNLWTVSPVSIDDELLRFPSCHVSLLYKISLLQSHTSSSHVTILTQFPSSMWFPRWNGLFRSSFAAVMREKQHVTRNQKSYWWALKSLLQDQSLLNVFFRPSSASSAFSLLPLFFFSSSSGINNTDHQCYQFRVIEVIPSSFRSSENEEKSSNTSPVLEICKYTR